MTFLIMFSQVSIKQFTTFPYIRTADAFIGDFIHDPKYSFIFTGFVLPEFPFERLTIEATQIVNLTVLGEYPPLQGFGGRLWHTDMDDRGFVSRVEQKSLQLT
jgi:hypothetical protein